MTFKEILGAVHGRIMAHLDEVWDYLHVAQSLDCVPLAPTGHVTSPTSTIKKCSVVDLKVNFGASQQPTHKHHDYIPGSHGTGLPSQANSPLVALNSLLSVLETSGLVEVQAGEVRVIDEKRLEAALGAIGIRDRAAQDRLVDLLSKTVALMR